MNRERFSILVDPNLTEINCESLYETLPDYRNMMNALLLVLFEVCFQFLILSYLPHTSYTVRLFLLIFSSKCNYCTKCLVAVALSIKPH